jgi:nucleotide-binding universal stress UspA family protein
MTGRPVIAGTDGSEESLLAVEWAGREASLRSLPLLVVSALPPPPWAPPGGIREDVLEVARKRLERALVTAADRAAGVAPGLRIDTQVVSGPPALALTALARDASLLVLGTRGAGGFAAMILGSVSRYAAAHASCPVVVVREETMAVHREIVAGVRDLDHPGRCAALEFAFAEAALRSARLVAVHAWYWSVPASRLDAPEVPPAAASRLAAVLAPYQAAYPGVEVREDVVNAHPGRVLAGASARADLVVLGRHPDASAEGHGVRSVTHAVLSHAHGPVAVVPGG